MKYSVTVKPGSAKDEVTRQGAEITVKTRKKAHDGEANAAVVELLAKHFKVGKTSIHILKGEKSRHKIVEVL